MSKFLKQATQITVVVLSLFLVSPVVFASTKVFPYKNGSDVAFSGCTQTITFVRWLTGGGMTSQASDSCSSISATDWNGHYVSGEDSFDMWVNYTSSGITYYGDILTDFNGLPDSELEALATTTRIVSVTSPLNYTSTSTSVTFSGSYYLSSDDASIPPPTWFVDPVLRLFISDEGFGTTTKIISIPITVLDSIVTFSTTTTLLDNYRYAWTVDLRGNNNEPLGSGKFPDGSDFWQFTTGVFDPTNGKAFDLSVCNLLSGFSATDCLSNLIMPNDIAFSSEFEKAKSSYMRRAPWGYVTRFLEIMASTTATTSLPVISYTFGSSTPFFGSVGTISFDPFSSLASAGNIVNTAVSDQSVQKTVWQIFDPVVNLIVYLTLLVLIIIRLTGIELHSNDPDYAVKGTGFRSWLDRRRGCLLYTSDAADE
mgnify:CR=1 FL=1